MEPEKLSASEWLKRKRNEGCPLHGFHIPDSLVKYSGYCRHCNRFWRFTRIIEKKDIPYWWFYFDPETQTRIGEVYSGRKGGKRTSHKNQTRPQGNRGMGKP